MKRKHKDLPKQRNPFVEHMRFKVAGAHGKPKKVQRRDDKMALKNGSVAELVQRWTFNPCQREFEPHPIHHYFDDTLLIRTVQNVWIIYDG